MSAATENILESTNDSFIDNDGNDLNSPCSNPFAAAAAAANGERPAEEDTTIVTNENENEEDSDEYYTAPEEEEEVDAEDDEEQQWAEAGDWFLNDGVPAEVNVSFSKNDNDNNDDDESSCDDGTSSDAESDIESEEDAVEESEVEDNDAEDSADEYETDEDEDSIDSEQSEEIMGDTSCCSTPSQRTSNSSRSRLSDVSQHELFLPWNISPSTESLKYDEEDCDDSSDDEDDDTAHNAYYHRTYMMGNNRNSGRPRMWDGCPSSISVSSNSSSSSEGSASQDSRSNKKRKAASAASAAAKAGVSFSNSVTVYPVFETRVYPPSMVRDMYTKRDELRVNKIRNKREFAYDLHDWRNATEEEEMETNEKGELIHPVHSTEKPRATATAPPVCRTRNVVQTYSSALGGYTTGVVHRAKRMRMYYP